MTTYWTERASSLREWAAKMRRRAVNPSLPFGLRYSAAVLAEDLEDQAKQFDDLDRRQTDAA